MSYAIKKAGIPFKVKVETSEDLTGKAAGFTVKYIEDATDTETVVSGDFVESATVVGLYLSPEINIPSVGDYTLVIKNDDIGMKNYPSPVVVVAASIDDVKDAVDSAQLDITAIKAKTDLLNTDELEGISEQIVAVDSSLSALTELINSEDAEDSITSIRELLADIKAGGVNVDSLINGQADLGCMLRGDEFLSDGTTSNPLFGNGLDEIYGKVETLLTDAQTAITDAKDAVVANTNAARDEVKSVVADVQTVVDANSAKLGDTAYGLEALKGLIDGVAADVASGESNLTDILQDATNGLAAIKTDIMSRFDSVDSALASANDKLDSIGGASSFRAFA